MKKIVTLFVLCLLGVTPVMADELHLVKNQPDNLEYTDSMNGITFESVYGFWDKWRPLQKGDLTDRRLIKIYANDLAWDAMKYTQSIDAGMPEGAMLGKISTTLSDTDPAYLITTFQVMSRYKDTDGKLKWRYASFSPRLTDGYRLPEQDKTEAQIQSECIACHDLLRERGHSFVSQR